MRTSRHVNGTRRWRLRPPRAISAVAAQSTQALGSFLIQVVAARELGAAGFGMFAFLFGSIVMATALTSGLVGDSLTVLDRFDPAIRSALRLLAVASVGTAAIIAAAGGALSGLGGSLCLQFATAAAAFMVADLLRRMLMANMRFWHLVLADSLALAVMMLVLVSGFAVSRRPSLGVLLLALTAGQLTTTVVASLCLPSTERMPVPWRCGAVGVVVRFGAWRAAQQFVRPTMLNVARWLVMIAVGSAALGELEAARVYLAPAMLVVQGVGSYLISSYAADRRHPTSRLLQRADTASAGMVVAVVAMSTAAVFAVPVVAPLITGGAYELSVIAVIGWGAYAASCAAVMPFGSLAAVRGRQSQVFILRVVDSIMSIGFVAALLLPSAATSSWTPLLLSVGSFFGGIVCRQLILCPVVRAEATSVPTHEPASFATDGLREAGTRRARASSHEG